MTTIVTAKYMENFCFPIPIPHRCYSCGDDATKVVINSHNKYAHCSWKRKFCDDCWHGKIGDDSGVMVLGDRYIISSLPPR